MSAPPFVFVDGSPESEIQNKKLVRNHVAKYFHKGRRPQPKITRTYPKPIMRKGDLQVSGEPRDTATSENNNRHDAELEVQIHPIRSTLVAHPPTGDQPASATNANDLEISSGAGPAQHGQVTQPPDNPTIVEVDL